MGRVTRLSSARISKGLGCVEMPDKEEAPGLGICFDPGKSPRAAAR
jgi:hypothetical protein